MVIHQKCTNQPTGKKAMSETYVVRSQWYVKRLGERHEPSAIASMLKISPGTLQNLWRGRLKSIPVDLYMRLCDVMAAELRREIGHLEHEIALVSAGASRHSDGEISAMVAQVAALKRTLEARK